MKRIGVGIAVLCCLLARPVLSQDQPADTMQILIEKIRADKKLLVASNVALTETEAKGFWPIYESYQKELEALNARTTSLIQDYARHYQQMTDEVAKRLVEDYLAIEQNRLLLKQSYLSKLREVIPEQKVARYLQIENKIEAAMRFEFAEKIPLLK